MIIKTVPLKYLTTIKQKGWVEVYFLEKIEEVGKYEFLIGGGSNIVLKNKKQIYKLSRSFDYIRITKGLVQVGGATSLKRLISVCVRRGISGMEFLAGVPATIGGAVFMNAGAFGEEMKDVIEYVKLTDGCKVWFIDSSNFEYRKSNITDGVIIEVGLRLQEKPSEIVAKKVRENVRWRLSHTHLTNTCGSVFKNPTGVAAAWLIENVGLKGYVKGSVKISDKHANFIISNGNADADDILFLIDKVKSEVVRSFGIELEEEVIVA